MTSKIEETLGIEPDRELMARLRHQALTQVGLVNIAGANADQDNNVPILLPPETRPRILDTELIAIYW